MAANKGQNVISIGDRICFYSEDTKGFVFSYQTSEVQNRIGVGVDEDKKNPAVGSPLHIMFELVAPNRYKATKKLKKVKVELKEKPEDVDLLAQMKLAEKAAEAEETANEVEQKRQKGKTLNYGQHVQLKHVFTGKYLHVNTAETSNTEPSHLSTELLVQNGKTCQFKLVPRYKVKAEGDVIVDGDLIVLECVKSAGQYLHVSKIAFGSNSVYEGTHELNLSVALSGFTLFKSSSADLTKYQFNPIHGCEVVRLFHKEREGLLCAEGVFGGPIIEQPHLRLRPVVNTNVKTLVPSSSAINFWMILKEDCCYDGSPLLWGENIRLMHITTGRLLMVKSDGAVCLSDTKNDPTTVFKFHPVVKREDRVTHAAFARIQHVLTDFWIADGGEEHKRAVPTETNPDGKPMLNIRYSKAVLRSLKASQTMMYDDAYAVEAVDLATLSKLCFVAGLVPFVHKLLQEFKGDQLFDSRRMIQVESAMLEMKNCMIKGEGVSKSHQKLMRNHLVVDMMVDLTKCHIINKEVKDFIDSTQASSFSFIQTYLTGDSRKNEMYIAKHMTFFQTQISREGPAGLNASFMLMALLKDNLFLIDLTTEQHIKGYIALIKRKKNHRYLQLLHVLCLCQGLPVQDKQIQITKSWLEESYIAGENVLFNVSLGQHVGLSKDVLYISTDMKETWVPLSDFSKDATGENAGNYKFLVNQLQLLSYLSKGRNEYASQMILDKLELVNMDIAFLALKDETLPGELRGKFCAFIKDLYVDVTGNYSGNDRELLIFPYNDIAQAGSPLAKKQRGSSIGQAAVPVPYSKELKRWIFEFLKLNAVMVATDPMQNLLIEQVMKLVCMLMDFGYYGDTEDIKILLDPTLRMIDGKTDLPEKDCDKETLKLYQEKGRFLKNTNNAKVVAAKYEAMKAIELFFNLRFNTRMVRFISEFKFTYYNQKKSDLTPFLTPDHDFQNDVRLHRISVRRTTEVFRETEYLGKDFIEVLKDLMSYKFEDIVTQSLMLLNQYYTAFENIFLKCVQTKLAITEKSNFCLKRVQTTIPQLKILKSNKLTKENTEKLMEILEEYIRFATVEEDVREPHPMNQEVLYNFDVLGDVFDIVTKIYVISEHDEDALNVLKICLRLLRCMCRSHETAQERLFNRIDLLFQIKTAQTEIGEMLIEIFSGNMSNCLKVQANHVETIAEQYASSWHPVWVALLTAIVMVNQYPIKRNQAMVVRSLMHHKNIVSLLSDGNKEEKIALLSNDESDKELADKRNRFCAVANLFALCAAGENKSIESICQCLLGMDELLDYINLPNLCGGLKAPVVKFLVWPYLLSNTEGAQSIIGKIGQDHRYGDYIDKAIASLTEAAEVLQDNISNSVEMFKFKPKILHKSFEDKEHETSELVHYCADAIVPFLASVFGSSHWEVNIKLKSDQVDQLIVALEKFAKACIPCQNDKFKRLQLLNLLRQISVTTGKYFPIPKDLTSEAEIVTDARKIYAEYYTDEEVINDLFDANATRMKISYGHRNTLKQQLGFPSKSIYLHPDSEAQFPLGNEFQTLVHCFILKSDGKFKRKYNAEGLIMHLNHSWNTNNRTESEKVNLAKLDQKLFQVIRVLIYNELVKQPSDKMKDPDLYDRMVDSTLFVQRSLSEQGIVGATLPHLSRPNGNVVKEALNLLNTLFENNTVAPESFCDFVKATNHEAFFAVMQIQLTKAESLIKEQRFLTAFHERVKAETQNLYDSTRSMEKEGKKDMSLLNAIKAVLTTQGRVKPLELALKEQMEIQGPRFKRKINEEAFFGGSNEDRQGTPGIALPESPQLTVVKDTKYVNVLLGIFRYLCDGQYGPGQDILRVQPNPRIVNIIAEVCQLLAILQGNIDANYIDMSTATFECMCEMIKGSFSNQAVIFDNKVLDGVNQILLVDEFKGASHEQVTQFLSSMGYFLMFLLEENKAKDSGVPSSNVMMASVNRDGLWRVVRQCYDSQKDSKLSKADKYLYVECGVIYFHICLRAVDLKIMAMDDHSDDAAWKFYADNSVSVEFIKGNIMQKIHFRVTNLTKLALRSEAEEKLIWEVDRSNPGKKMRDYTAFVKDIARDIKTQRRINARIVGRFFVQRWKAFNNLIMFMSFAIQVCLMAMWEYAGDTKPPITEPPQLVWFDNYVQYCLGFPHNVISFNMIISYFLSNSQSYISWYHTFIARWKRRINVLRGKDKASAIPRQSKYAVSPYSGLTIYYFMFFLCSLMGSLVSPAFYSFHLLQIIQNSQILTRVIKSVTSNGISLVLVVIMLLILIYIHALIGFLVLRNIFTANYIWCDTLLRCTVSVIREALIFRITRFNYPTKNDKNFNTYALKLIYDMSFYAIILTIGLSVISGMIIDTFRSLRDNKFNTEKENASKCFFCSKNGYEFEQKGVKFQHHVMKEHPMVGFIFLFIKMDDTPENHLTSLELFISDMLKKDNLNFYPVGRAISIDGIYPKDSASQASAALLAKLETIGNKINEESVAQAAELTRVKEKEWKDKYAVRRSRSADGRLKTAKERPTPSGKKSGKTEKIRPHSRAPSTADPRAVRPRLDPDIDDIPDLDEVLPPGHSFLSAASNRGASRGGRGLQQPPRQNQNFR